MHIYEVDEAFARKATELMVGKTVRTAEPVDTGTPVHAVRIIFTDGSSVLIQSEHDEGFVLSQEHEEGHYARLDVSNDPDAAGGGA